MEIISEKEISNKQAIHFLKKSAKDSYIEENDPELAKNLSLVLTELQAHSNEIIVNNQQQGESLEKAKEEEPNEEEKSPEEKPKSEEEKPAEEKHRHRKHRSHKKSEEE